MLSVPCVCIFFLYAICVSCRWTCLLSSTLRKKILLFLLGLSRVSILLILLPGFSTVFAQITSISFSYVWTLVWHRDSHSRYFSKMAMDKVVNGVLTIRHRVVSHFSVITSVVICNFFLKSFFFLFRVRLLTAHSFISLWPGHIYHFTIFSPFFQILPTLRSIDL